MGKIEVCRFTLTPVAQIHRFPVFSKQPASENFKGKIIHSGSQDISCEFCGRYHLGEEYLQQAEDQARVKRLVAEAEAKPNGRVVLHDRDMVSWGTLDGKQWVVDCPCNAGAVYERFIWAHLGAISGYTRERAQAALEIAQENLACAQAIPAH